MVGGDLIVRRIQTPKLACDSAGSIDECSELGPAFCPTLDFPVHVKGQNISD
jgi:hypothetical protein